MQSSCFVLFSIPFSLSVEQQHVTDVGNDSVLFCSEKEVCYVHKYRLSKINNIYFCSGILSCDFEVGSMSMIECVSMDSVIAVARSLFTCCV